MMVLDGSKEMVIKLNGSLDTHSTPALRSVVDFASLSPKNVVVDMSKVSFIDSSGVAVIVSMFKRRKATGLDLQLKGVQKQPASVLNLLGLDQLLSNAA
jgi:anti-anti-sigma factor